MKYQTHLSNLLINFFDYPSNIFIIINFDFGTVKWNYKKNDLTIAKYKNFSIKKIDFKKFKRNDMFKFQMENFINSIFKKEKINSDLFNAINTLKLCMKLKKMILSNKNILIIGAAGLIVHKLKSYS